MNMVEEIQKLAKSIELRTNNDHYFILANIEDWLDHNEIGLAIDEIVDRIVEYDMPITQFERDKIIEICKFMGNEMRASEEYLSQLVMG